MNAEKRNSEQNKVSVFKQVYSRHKRQGKNPNRIDDLLGEDGCCGVIDVTRIGNRVGKGKPCFGEDLVTKIESVLRLPVNIEQNPAKKKSCSCFCFREFPGVFLYSNALDLELQLRLAYDAVTEYCELDPTTICTTPHVSDNSNRQSNYNSHQTNIDLLPPKAHECVNELDNKEETMWNLWKQDQVQTSNADISSIQRPEKKAKKNGHNSRQTKNNYYRQFSKLSWATMGYHYDWTERSYYPQKKSKMPNLVAKVSTLFATASPTANNNHEYTRMPSTFTPSASIVNYYTTKSTMGGHRDDLEDQNAMDKPIVSISLGLPGIFVLGGPTKDEFESADENATAPHPVRALLLRPGDVLVMGGVSRLNYHAMARVLPYGAGLEYEQRIGAKSETKESSVTSEAKCGVDCYANLSPMDLSLELSKHPREHGERKFLVEYLKHHRVNINVRQVYPDE